MVARLGLCAVGLALAAPPVRAEPGLGAPADQTGLFQISKVTFDNDGKSGEVAYASDDFKVGMLVEARMLNGTWVPGVLQRLLPGEAYDIKTPGEDLKNVSAKLLRRHLEEREFDWLVVNKGLPFPGAYGVAYRLSKKYKDVAGETYAPFNSLVVGRDEGDGWLKVNRGYLPTHVSGVPVLVKTLRKGAVALSRELRDWYLGTEETRRKAAMAKAALQAPPLTQSYTASEEVLFQTGDGEWRPARVVSTALTGYDVRVQHAGGNASIVSRVLPRQLRKAGPPPPKNGFAEGESPLCRREGGCIEVVLKAESGKEHRVRAAMGMPIQSIIKAACAKIQDPWSCQTRVNLSLRGQWLNPHWRTFEAGLTNGTVVDMRLAPESVTHVGQVSA